MTMWHRVAVGGLLLIAGGLGLSISPGDAATPRYDGDWSVLVVTEKGTCDRGYRYPIRVQNGQVLYRGEAGISISGRVEDNGRVRVTIGRGDQSASGSGRLSGEQGSGRWEGRSPTSECSGSWRAERRGAD